MSSWSLVYRKFLTEEARRGSSTHTATSSRCGRSCRRRQSSATTSRRTSGSVLCAAARNAFSDAGGFRADLEHKTKRLVEESATQEGLGRSTKVATFDVDTLEALGQDDGPPEEKVYNLLRGPRKEMEDNPAAAVVLQSIKEKVDRVIENLEERKVNGLAALDEIKAIAEEKDRMREFAKQAGPSDRACNEIIENIMNVLEKV